MVRYKNLKDKILDPLNIIESEKRARKGKASTYGVKRFDRRDDLTLDQIRENLNNCTHKTSKYHIFKVYEPKEREIYLLPYYPDRIVHHIMMRILEPIFEKWFIKNTYSCIKNRGIHKVLSTIEHDLRTDPNGTRWCLKLDIKKFYPSITQSKLITMLSWKIKDKWVINILREIIYSTDKGIPIGNYLSQFFANIYLTKIDHYIKEVLRLKHYYRYCDDIVILGNNKKALNKIFRLIKQKLKFVDLNLKPMRLFPTESGIDFVGYVFRRSYTKVRKRLKILFKRAVNKNKSKSLKEFQLIIASYYGWLIHCDAIHLLKMYINNIYYGFKKHYFKNCGVRTCIVGKCRKTLAR